MFLLCSAFIAGILTVLAPCVLPLLPIIIGGSVSGSTSDKKRPLIIAISLAASLIFFTLLLKATTLLVDIPPQAITYVSGGIVVALGVVMLFPKLYALFIAKTGIEQRAQGLLGTGYRNKNSLVGPIIIGAALGPVFSSCSPVYAYILATVLPANFGRAFLYIVSYVLGLSIVLLAIGYYGRRFTSRIAFASNPRGWFQRVIAIVFIVVGLLIVTGYDKRFQTFVSDHTVINVDSLNKRLLPKSQHQVDASRLFNVQSYKAPEFAGLTNWINSEPLTMSQLKGKVVLVDFWTYSCINCIRNNPYIEQWYQSYKDDGFVVVGVHAPEFAFEKNVNNVAKAVKDQGITYPVALDNDLDTWNAFLNQSWPAGYLIDANGNVRRLHEGEGNYKESEQAIRQLLEENGAKLSSKSIQDAAVPFSVDQTPETYLGSSRASNYAGTEPLANKPVQTFTDIPALDRDTWSLSGTWQIDADKIVARGGAKLRFHVAAKDVYLVAGSDSPQMVGVKVDGKPLSQTGFAGSDSQVDAVTIDGSRLYRIVSFPAFSSQHTIELTVPDGVSLNTFTFGS